LRAGTRLAQEGAQEMGYPSWVPERAAGQIVLGNLGAGWGHHCLPCCGVVMNINQDKR